MEKSLGEDRPGEGSIAMNLQRHHIIVAVIAILVAFALAANYYLW